MARVSQLASSAAIEAVRDSGLDLNNENRTESDVSLDRPPEIMYTP